MVLRAIDAEIGKAAIRARQFRANARISRLQTGLVQGRPPAPDTVGKSTNTLRIDPIAFFVNPFHIRPKPGLASQIESQMNAEPTGFGYGIDQSIEWMAATEAEIHTTGQPLFRPRTLWQPRPQPRKCRGTKSSGVNHFPSLQGQISGLTHLQNMLLRTGFGKHHRTVQRNLATGVFQITLQRQHQAMT